MFPRLVTNWIWRGPSFWRVSRSSPELWGQNVGVLLSQDVADRVEQADLDYLVVRVGALARVPGNPDGAAVRRVGRGCAFLVSAVPNPVFNHVTWLTVADVGVLPELGRWYRGHGVSLRVEVTPGQADPVLFDALAREGLRQSGFYGGLYAPAVLTEPVSGVVVEAAEPDEFARVYVAGFGFPERRRVTMARSMTVMAGEPGCLFFRARVGSATDGVGMLFLANGTGYLATAATLPDSRGRGVQTALIRHRIGVAARVGADLIVGHAAVGSGSQRTMERCGLRVAYTKAIWTEPVS
jgi:GNAT superfamily N-acetyltransferase